jgi:hypothetical protein
VNQQSIFLMLQAAVRVVCPIPRCWRSRPQPDESSFLAIKKQMPRHFGEFVEAHESPGVIIVPQSVRISTAVEELIVIWRDASDQELRNRLRWVRRRS